jgi:hypothetical protein
VNLQSQCRFFIFAYPKSEALKTIQMPMGENLLQEGDELQMVCSTSLICTATPAFLTVLTGKRFIQNAR